MAPVLESLDYLLAFCPPFSKKIEEMVQLALSGYA